MKSRFCDVLESCCVKRSKVRESVVEAVGLAVELVNDAVITSPGVINVFDPHIDD